jgi:hypothetical protein
MIKLFLQPTDNVITTINKIRGIADLNIELNIPKESVLFENYLNLKLIQHEADKMEKSIEFVTNDDIGNNLISSLMGGGTEAYVENVSQGIENNQEESKTKKKLSLPSFNLSFIGLIISKPIGLMKRLLGNKRGLLVPVFIILILLTSFIWYGLKAPKASAKISVRSQALTKSVTIKVKTDSSTDVKTKILRGTTLSTTIESTLEKAATGTKMVGEKATGDITIYNKTSSAVKLDKGDKVVYEGKTTDLNYYLNDDVDIPAAVSGSTPAENVPGEANIEVVASAIGDSFNIDSGKTLSVSGYKSSELAAETKEKISGGKSEEIKIVTAEDRTNLSNELKILSTRKGEDDIKNKLGLGQKLVIGSTQVLITKESFTKNVGDESANISLTQIVSGDGLTYMDSELNRFIDEYVKDVIPENFVLSEKDREVKVEVLGNSTSSVLTSKEADLQVTLKTFIVPNINEEGLKEELKGKSAAEAQKILGSIKNVNSYEFNLSPVIPFFRNVPNDLSRIEITIVKE